MSGIGQVHQIQEINRIDPIDQSGQVDGISFRRKLQAKRRTVSWREILKLAVDSFRASKLRFILTVLGMVIGTASVILVVTIGLTGKQFILQEIEKIGTNEIELEYGGNGSSGSLGLNQNGYLTRADERAVDEQIAEVVYSSPILEIHDHIGLGGGKVRDTLVLGVDPQYLHIRNLLISSGRFLDEIDDRDHMKCAVVTEAFARLRYGSIEAAVGKPIQLSGMPFTIVGVFTQSVSDFGESEIANETILIPYSVAHFLTGTDEVKQIYFSMRSMADVQGAAKDIERIVRSRHNPNYVYNTTDLREVLTMAATISNIITAVLVLVAAVTLAVGGVGIMNIMLANVSSRIREIGIRKALGATQREIKLQFLSEALIISLSGGVLGSFVGLALPLSVRIFSGYDLPINLWSVLVALMAAGCVGVIFGTLPASQAARLDPVDSLRSE